MKDYLHIMCLYVGTHCLHISINGDWMRGYMTINFDGMYEMGFDMREYMYDNQL